MRNIRCIAAGAALLLAAAAPAAAQKSDQPVTGYKPVAVALPQPVADDSFDALRKQVGEAALRKDRAALAKLVVARGFFWQRDSRIIANKRKAGFDVLAAALGLNHKEGAGWEILASTTEDPTASPVPSARRPSRPTTVRPSPICSP